MNSSKKTFIIQIVVSVAALISAISLGYYFQRDIKMQAAVGGSQRQNSPIVKADSYSFTEINQLCDGAGAKLQTKEVLLNFEQPAPGDGRKTACPWGLGDNLTPRASKVSSRYEQIAMAPVPQKTVLCGLQFEIDPKPFQRRDYFILTLNSRVLVTDAEFLFQYLQEETVALSENEKISSYIYDWSRVLGMRAPKDYAEAARREYCVGRDITLANCLFGNGEPPQLDLHSKVVRWLGTKSMGPSLRFGLIVTGDKDVEEDCFHTPLQIKVKMQFAELSQ